MMVCLLSACGMNMSKEARRVEEIKRDTLKADLSLPGNNTIDTDYDVASMGNARDTLIVQDEQGNDMFIMKAIRDETTGEMVANETLDAAVVTARFTNVAERHGKIDLQWQIRIPAKMQDSRWQLRLNSDMFIMEDSLRLDPIIITGRGYRETQLKGYEQYNRFLSKIIKDSTSLLNTKQLEVFLQRNIPQIYAFKTDSSAISEDIFFSSYGVSEQSAIKHYTRKARKSLNDRRKQMKDTLFNKYVKVPIVTDGIRLDTIIHTVEGDFIYNYTQTINTKPDLRKADIGISGEIYDQDRRIYTIPPGEPLSFYISSVSTFVEKRDRYLSRVIERKASANTSCDIIFDVNRTDVNPSLGNNKAELNRLKENLSDLLSNRLFEMDSIIVTSSSSPEGSIHINKHLSQSRSESISRYLNKCIKAFQDSLDAKQGFMVDLDGNIIHYERVKIPFVSKSIPENWSGLDYLIEEDDSLTDSQKSSYRELSDIKDPDVRENQMKQLSCYNYLRNNLYPKLRTVRFDFHLHRKGMTKDTIMTTIPDSVYISGVEAIENRDYQTAAVLLAPYQDINTAIAYINLDRNHSALEILENEEPTSKVMYLKAILYCRLGDDQKAVQYYLDACKKDSQLVYRGNLDPEIKVLILRYGLNKELHEDDSDY